MINKNQVSLKMKEFLESDIYSPLSKFFILMYLEAVFHAENEETRNRIWNEINEYLRRQNNE